MTTRIGENWPDKIEGTPIDEDEGFERMLEQLRRFREALYTCEARISENAHVLKRLFSFMTESLLHFSAQIKKHTLNDLN